jgi:hypothetical protein
LGLKKESKNFPFFVVYDSVSFKEAIMPGKKWEESVALGAPFTGSKDPTLANKVREAVLAAIRSLRPSRCDHCNTLHPGKFNFCPMCGEELHRD